MNALKSLSGFRGPLAAAFKRVVNIVRKFGESDAMDTAKLTQPEERALLAAAEAIEQQAGDLISNDRYEEYINAVVGLKPAVDDFFDHVLVDDPDPAVKANRLALLTRIWRLFEHVADFSRITT